MAQSTRDVWRPSIQLTQGVPQEPGPCRLRRDRPVGLAGSGGTEVFGVGLPSSDLSAQGLASWLGAGCPQGH